MRAHWRGFFAVTTPSSRSPSSGRASGKASIPPMIVPTFAASTHETRPLKKRLPSTSTVAFIRRAPRFFMPVYRYAARPSRSLRPRSAWAIIRASNPAPAITVKRSPFTEPVSMRRRCPCNPIRTASVMSSGICRFIARRFAVPAGRIATAVSVPATASMQRWTVPSPPQTNSTSTPRSAARRACSGARRLFFTSCHIGAVTPSASRTFRSSGRPPPRLLRECATTATFGMPDPHSPAVPLTPSASGPRTARRYRRRPGQARPASSRTRRMAGFAGSASPCRCRPPATPGG